MVLAHPDRAAGLVLVDTGPGYRNDAARDSWNRMAAGYAGQLDAKGLQGLPGSSDELSPSVHSTATGLAITARNVLTQHDAHVIDGLPTIEAPTLVVVGSDDEPFVKGSSYMAGKIPGATLAVIEGAGHAPPVTHSDEFNTVLRTYLEGLRHEHAGRSQDRRQVLAARQLGPGPVAAGVAAQARRVGLGHADVAGRLVRPRPAGLGRPDRERGVRGDRRRRPGGRRRHGSRRPDAARPRRPTT